ncbi:MAG TPA: glycosyltransferase [Pseudomonadota bacterium]|nr:glycosyltransferase [Pseudomonadota bacterium]
MVNLLYVAAFCHAALALLLWFNRARTPRLPEVKAHPDRPKSVVVIVPARNEESNIGPCVRSILLQDYPALTVRVVDDHSTDHTGAIVGKLAEYDRRLTLIHPPSLPPGWLGKPHAVHNGSLGATADYLLFLDADVRLEPSAVSRAVALAEAKQAGLTTVMPELVAESFWERATQPLVGLLLYGLLDPVRVNDPNKDSAAGFGPFMLFRRDAYEKLGGHQAVRSEIVEDLKLSQLVKAQRLGLCVAHGTDVVKLRMYDSLSSLLAGWTKNFHVALGPLKALAPLFAILIAAVFTLPTVMFWTLIGLWAATGHLPHFATAAALAYGADWCARLSLHSAYDITPRGVRAVGGLVVGYILCSSVYRALFGRPVTWRGRSYQAQ